MCASFWLTQLSRLDNTRLNIAATGAAGAFQNIKIEKRPETYCV